MISELNIMDLPLFNWQQAEQRTRADQILTAFENFHKKNPDVWRLFKKFALQVVSTDRKYYSAKAIFERIRWHVEIENRGDEVKLNNNFTAYYARLFHLAYPEYDGFFRNRKLISENIGAYEQDIQVFDSGLPGSEDSITARLQALLVHED
jgi:hypothetical protein